MDLLKQICEELGRDCPDELPDVLVNVNSDHKVKRWVIRNCELSTVKKTKSRKAKEVKVNVEENNEEANESEVSIATQEE